VKIRIALLLGTLVLVLVVGFVSVRRVGDQISVLGACEAARDGRWSDALAATADRVGGDETGRAAVTCRCRALLATQRGDECTALLENTLAEETTKDWVPAPDLSAHLIQLRRDAGHAREAAILARRASRAYPENADLFFLELVTRGAVEDESAVLAELERRIAPEGPAAARMRGSLANRHLLRADPESALAVLGENPPDGAGDAAALWHEARASAFASAGDLAGIDRTYEQWRRRGGDETELRARYALTLSLGKLEAPGESTLSRLERALSSGPHEDRLDEAITIRLVLSLVAAGRIDNALAAYDRGRKRFPLEGLTREEILRSAEHRRLAGANGDAAPALIHFRLDPARPGAHLEVSPGPGQPVDAPYEHFELTTGTSVSRQPGVAPVRWVLRDASDRTLASGSISPAPGGQPVVQIGARPPAPDAETDLSRRPGDDRRRLVMLLLDCGDWRIVQYLRARGELPVLSRLLTRGHSAVRASDPPLTAAALEALVWPQRTASPGLLGLLHRYGTELAGLATIGDNPFRAPEWVLPESPDLFEVLGAGPHTAANLLFSHGGVKAGRHGDITGPDGAHRRLPLGTAGRDLNARERADFPALAAVKRERDAIHLRRIAAEFDAAEHLVDAGKMDFVALRIESLDILTHAHFAYAVRSRQDDGKGLLFSVYRYLDARLGALHDRLDEDDVLIVMSDHGIRTAMEHSRFAFFVAAGEDVPPGRAPETPALRGVSRAIADILGVPTAWPDTGIAPWARPAALARGPTAPHPAQHAP
jgi:hypothetical protein